MTIKRLILIIALSMSCFCISIIGLLYHIKINEDQLVKAQNIRYQSFILADQLRQSSDDLTRFSRTYAATGNEIYKKFYFEVLAIRNGEKPRPNNYERMYWDFIIDDLPEQVQGNRASLLDLMKDAGFSREELVKLKQAEDQSNHLVASETIALDLTDKAASLADRFSAIEILHDRKYHVEKSKIMAPIDVFFVMMEERTKGAVDLLVEEDKKLFIALVIITMLLVCFTCWLTYTLIIYVLKPLGEEPKELKKISENIAEGNFDFNFHDDHGGVYQALNCMSERLRNDSQLRDEQSWLQKGSLAMGDALRRSRDLEGLGGEILSVVSEYLKIQVGVIYVWEEGICDDGSGELRLLNSFSGTRELMGKDSYKLGEGLLGQAAKSKNITVINDVPVNHFSIMSATGSSEANSLVLFSFFFHDELQGVIEIGLFRELKEIEIEFLENVRESIGVTFEHLIAKQAMKKYLESEQFLSEELQVQQEELRVSNDTLRTQTDDLEKQKNTLQVSKLEIEEKAKQLEQASIYKTEFLANMSHELRTPLNSLLILAGFLKGNESGNLNLDEVNSARVIEESGKHLLGLINHILDLSKVETGNMEVHNDLVILEDIKQSMLDRFIVLSEEKGIEFDFIIADSVPSSFVSDGLKLEQILNNLIGNGIKFTSKGRVSVSIELSELQDGASSEAATEVLKFNIKDSGIGIKEGKREEIFEAFRQEDGSTTRRYGGTGLGLSISKELASLLGGYIELDSQENVGSTFSFYLPVVEGAEIKRYVESEAELPEVNSHCGRDTLLLIGVKPNSSIKSQLIDVFVEECISCEFADSYEDVIRLLNSNTYVGIIFDFDYIKSSSDNVLKILSDYYLSMPEVIIYSEYDLSDNDYVLLKNHSDNVVMVSESFIEHMRTIILSLLKVDGSNAPVETAEITEPSNLDGRNILLVDDDMRNTFSLAKVLRGYGINVEIALNSKQALEILDENKKIELICLDIMMPDMDGYQTIKEIKSNPELTNIPIITVTANNLAGDRSKCLEAGADDYLSKPIDMRLLLSRIEHWL